MTLDSFERNIKYLRISVTDRCNLRCPYCMPADPHFMSESTILTRKEIVDFVTIALEYDISKIRLTGGEPLTRADLLQIIEDLKKLPGIKELSLTTNAQNLASMAKKLKQQGLDRVNISLDSVDPEIYEQLTGGGNLQATLEGIKAAQSAGLNPKINCVIKNSPSEPEAKKVQEYCDKLNLPLRFIREMDLKKGVFYPVIGGKGGDCKVCDRIRLSSDGKLMPCLFNKMKFDIRELGFRQALEKALQLKPEKGKINPDSDFFNIGG